MRAAVWLQDLGPDAVAFQHAEAIGPHQMPADFRQARISSPWAL